MYLPAFSWSIALCVAFIIRRHWLSRPYITWRSVLWTVSSQQCQMSCCRLWILLKMLQSECRRKCRCSVNVRPHHRPAFFSNVQPADPRWRPPRFNSACVRLRHVMTKDAEHMTLSQFQVRFGHPGTISKHDSCWLTPGSLYWVTACRGFWSSVLSKSKMKLHNLLWNWT